MSSTSKPSIIQQIYQERTKEFHEIVSGLSEVEREIVCMWVRRTAKKHMVMWLVNYRIRGLNRGILNSDYEEAEAEVYHSLRELAHYFEKLVS